MCRVYSKYGWPVYIRLCYRFGNHAGMHIKISGETKEQRESILKPMLTAAGHYKDPRRTIRQVNKHRPKAPRCHHGNLIGNGHTCWNCETEKYRKEKEARNAGN